MTIHEPGPWAKDVEAACDRDRASFETHPRANMYVRRRMPTRAIEWRGANGWTEAVEPILPGRAG